MWQFTVVAEVIVYSKHTFVQAYSNQNVSTEHVFIDLKSAQPNSMEFRIYWIYMYVEVRCLRFGREHANRLSLLNALFKKSISTDMVQLLILITLTEIKIQDQKIRRLKFNCKTGKRRVNYFPQTEYNIIILDCIHTIIGQNILCINFLMSVTTIQL